MSEALNFTSLIVALPSNGRLYDNPKLAKGEIELRYGTTHDEDIITNQQYIARGIVFDKLIESLIIDKEININDLVMGDMNALLLSSRRAMYGDKYNVKITCPNCKNSDAVVIDLKSVEYFECGDEIVGNSFEITTDFGNVFKYHLLTYTEEKDLEEQQKRLKKLKISKDEQNITLRLKSCINAINDTTNKGEIIRMIEQGIPSIESLQIRNHMLNNMPDIDTSIEHICKECGFSIDTKFGIDIDFFWPAGRTTRD